MAATAAALALENNEKVQLLTFGIVTPSGTTHCGINIHKVREVIELSHLSMLPKDYAPFVGVHDLRGMPIPVMPLDDVFRDRDTAAPAVAQCGRILVIELQGKVIGLVVASTGQIRSFRNSEVLEPPAALDKVKGRFFNGVVRGEKGYIYLLDIEAILDSFGLSLDKESHSTLSQKRVFEGKRALIVEDSKVYQKKIRGLFESWGFTLEVAANGSEALELLEKNGYAFDLIFSDIEMPVMNGIELGAKLKTDPRSARIPLVFNSSLSNPMLIDEIKSKSLGGYIVKFDQEAIQAEILRWMKE